MTRTLSSIAAIACVLATAPASAQLLGGAGSLGGRIGGMGGAVSGNFDGMVDRTQSSPDIAARNQARAARHDRSHKTASTGSVDATAAAMTGPAAPTRAFASGSAASGPDGGAAAIDANAGVSRGFVAAERRGMQRVERTARGVPVFVAAPGVPVRVVAAPYPVFAGGAYYGGGAYIEGDSTVYMDRQYDDLRQEVKGTGATVFRRGRDLVVQLPGDVTFAFDKADIRPRFFGTLTAVANILDRYPATDVEIMGHTDSIGSDQYNLALSERRGRNVADFLVDQHTDPRRLVVEALGKSEPIATNATVAGRAANRRVEIVLHPRDA